MIGLCCVWYARLVNQGRNPAAFMTTLAHYAATAVNGGRRVCGQEKTKDLLSRGRPRQREFTVSVQPRTEDRSGESIESALRDNTQTPVPDQVQFRCDFPAWKQRLTVVKRQLVDRLALGHRTCDLAEESGLSTSRISQLRKEFQADYLLFCGNAVDD